MTQPLRRDDEPTRPLTNVEWEIARLAGRGYGINRIAELLHRKPTTIQSTIIRIALKLPNEDGLMPLTLVQLWAAHRQWLEEIVRDRPSAA